MARPPLYIAAHGFLDVSTDMSAQSLNECEAKPVDRGWNASYADDGSGESTRTAQLAGATPQSLNGVIPRGRTSSGAHGRKVVRRRVAAQRLQRMGREVHSQQGRQIPSLFMSDIEPAADDAVAARP